MNAQRPITDREIWRLAGPIILSNLSIPLLGLVDTVVMGYLPAARYLAAVGLGAMVFGFLFWGFGFLRMGTTGLVAQFWGAGDHRRIRATLLRASGLALAIATAILLLQQPIWVLTLKLLDAEPEVLALTADYFSTRIWSAPATLLNYALLGWFLGMQNTRASLVLMLTVNGINILLDIFFVWGLGWSVRGVAAASVIGEYCGLLVGLWWVRRLAGPGSWPLRQFFNPAAWRRLLQVNGDIMIRTFCLMFAFAFFTRQGGAQGQLILAANTVLMNFQNMMAYGLDGFAHAAEALVGRTVGARDRQRLQHALRLTAKWSALCAAAVVLIYAAGGRWMIDAMTGLADVEQAATRYLPWLVVSPLLSVWSFWLDGVLIGATRTRSMRNTMLISVLAVYLPVWWLSRPLGNHGLWLALMTFMLARAVTMAIALKRRPLADRMWTADDR